MKMPLLVKDLLVFLDFSRIISRKVIEIYNYKSPIKIISETKAALKYYSYIF